MEFIAVSDTNIFIDLIEIGLLDEFFALPWEIHTTDMVIHELKDEFQKEMVVKYHSEGCLRVKAYDTREMLTLAAFHASKRATVKVSIQDCSVWMYAMQNNYTLLTGDARLRKAAAKHGVDVHGILYVIDKLVESSRISPKAAVDKLMELVSLNPRLPLPEIETRIRSWQGG